MPSQEIMKAQMRAYIDLFNKHDAAAVSALYADDATVEDPVGTEPKRGREAIDAFYAGAMKTGAQLELVAPIRGSQGNSAAMAFDVVLGGGKMRIHVIDVMTFNEEGKFTSMRAFWGPSDMENID